MGRCAEEGRQVAGQRVASDGESVPQGDRLRSRSHSPRSGGQAPEVLYGSGHGCLDVHHGEADAPSPLESVGFLGLGEPASSGAAFARLRAGCAPDARPVERQANNPVLPLGAWAEPVRLWLRDRGIDERPGAGSARCGAWYTGLSDGPSGLCAVWSHVSSSKGSEESR